MKKLIAMALVAGFLAATTIGCGGDSKSTPTKSSPAGGSPTSKDTKDTKSTKS